MDWRLISSFQSAATCPRKGCYIARGAPKYTRPWYPTASAPTNVAHPVLLPSAYKYKNQQRRAALALALLAIPSLGNPTAFSPRAQIACSLKVKGVLQLRMPDNPNISATGASFIGPEYTVNGVQAQLLKIFAPNNADFEFHMCNSTFMGYTQRPSEFGTTFLYGQLKDKASGLCVTGSHLGDYVTTSFSAQPCSVRDNSSQLRQFFRFLAGSPGTGSTPDQNPQLMFIGVPQADNPNGADRYSFSFTSNNNAAGDSYPKVTAKNPRKENSYLGFYAPEYL